MSLCLTLLSIFLFFNNYKIVFADQLTDEINEQISLIDLTELDELFKQDGIDSLYSKIIKIANGDFDLNVNSFFELIFDNFIEIFKQYLPLFLSILSICLLFTVFNNFFEKSQSKINETISFVFLLIITIIFSSKIINIFLDVYKVIKTLLSINEIASPIILSIMVATGGKSSVAIYTPATVFITAFINNIVIKIMIPALIILMVVVISSNFSSCINTKKIEEFFSSIFKWFLGIFSILFTLILSISGISAGIFDGISVKTTKYILSSSVPIISGIVNSGFDFALASGIIIKNAIGLNVILLIVYTVIKPIIGLLVLSFFLKIITLLLQPLSEINIDGFCTSISKVLTFCAVILIITSLLLIIYFFLLVVSANAFI